MPLGPSSRTSRVVAALVGVVAMLALPSVAHGFDITLDVQDVESHADITDFTYLVSEDNAGRRTDPVDERPGVRPTPSYIPLVAAGDAGLRDRNIEPSDGRYLVTVKAPGHKLWGKHFSLTRRTPAASSSSWSRSRCRSGRLVVHAFHDRRPVNAAPGLRGWRGRRRRARPRGVRGPPPRHGRRDAGRLQRRPAVRRRLPDRRRRERHDPEPRARQVRDRGAPARRDRLAADDHVRGHAPDRFRARDRERRRARCDRRGGASHPGVRTAWWFGFVQPLRAVRSARRAPCGSIRGPRGRGSAGRRSADLLRRARQAGGRRPVDIGGGRGAGLHRLRRPGRRVHDQGHPGRHVHALDLRREPRLHHPLRHVHAARPGDRQPRPRPERRRP